MRKTTYEPQITAMRAPGEVERTSPSDHEHLAMITQLIDVVGAHVSEYYEMHAKAMDDHQSDALALVEDKLVECVNLLHSSGLVSPYATVPYGSPITR